MPTTKELCATVVFGETSLLRAPNGNESDLVAARRYIAGVVYARYEGHEDLFADPQTPTADQLRDASIAKHWQLCQDAARSAMGENLGTCLHFVISWLNAEKDGPSHDDPSIEDPWPFTEKGKITVKYGPFTRISRSDMFVLRYCGVHV